MPWMWILRCFQKTKLTFLQADGKNSVRDGVGGCCSGSRVGVSLRVPHEAIGLFDLGLD